MRDRSTSSVWPSAELSNVVAKSVKLSWMTVRITAVKIFARNRFFLFLHPASRQRVGRDPPDLVSRHYFEIRNHRSAQSSRGDGLYTANNVWRHSRQSTDGKAALVLLLHCSAVGGVNFAS